MSELDDLISKFYLGQDKPDSESVSKLIREFGVSPGDTERIHSMLNDLGYTDAQLGDINEMAKVAQGFLASMPDETRNQIMNFAFQAISNLELGEVPPEIHRLFETYHDASGNSGRSEDET